MHPHWVVACVALLLVGALVVLVYLTSGDQGAEGDMIHYVYWTRLVSVDGIQAAYSGTYHETYAVYPPVTLYGLALAGGAYRLWVDPAFDVDQALHSVWLVRAIKLTAVGWHLLCALAIYLLVQRQSGRGLAACAGLAYALNPVSVLITGYHGQFDSMMLAATFYALLPWLRAPALGEATREPTARASLGAAARRRRPSSPASRSSCARASESSASVASSATVECSSSSIRARQRSAWRRTSSIEPPCFRSSFATSARRSSTSSSRAGPAASESILSV